MDKDSSRQHGDILGLTPIADRISRDRFWELSRYMHFVDNATLVSRDSPSTKPASRSWLVKKLSKKTWWFFPFSSDVSVLTTRISRSFSAVAPSRPQTLKSIHSCCLPTPTPWFHAWLVSEACTVSVFSDERPWNLIIASSTATSLWGSYNLANLVDKYIGNDGVYLAKSIVPRQHLQLWNCTEGPEGIPYWSEGSEAVAKEVG